MTVLAVPLTAPVVVPAVLKVIEAAFVAFGLKLKLNILFAFAVSAVPYVPEVAIALRPASTPASHALCRLVLVM